MACIHTACHLSTQEHPVSVWGCYVLRTIPFKAYDNKRIRFHQCIGFLNLSLSQGKVFLMLIFVSFIRDNKQTPVTSGTIGDLSALPPCVLLPIQKYLSRLWGKSLNISIVFTFFFKKERPSFHSMLWQKGIVRHIHHTIAFNGTKIRVGFSIVLLLWIQYFTPFRDFNTMNLDLGRTT